MEAWSSCKPRGVMLDAKQLPQFLPNVSLLIPHALETPENAKKLNNIFQPPEQAQSSEQALPLFLQWVQPQDGFVNFLYFWRAFSDAAHLVSGDVPGGLPAEMEAFRDAILVRCESAGGRCLPAKALVDAVHAAAAASAFPLFWRTPVEMAAAMAEPRGSADAAAPELSLQEVALFVLSWVQDAPSWEQRQGEDEDFKQQLQARRQSEKDDSGIEVRLHIYDVSQEEAIQKINRVFAHEYSPLKFGGVFHAGVEVMGLEWAYGCSEWETLPGVSCNEPRQHPMHNYRETIILRPSHLSEEDVSRTVSQLMEEYPGNDYDLLRRNCCHFADDFCQRLGVGAIPGWVHRFARIGAKLDTAMQTAQDLREKYYGGVVPSREEEGELEYREY
eukprot:TRINITY_DN22387_c0_g1_i1.p1 TRINITY_DN22387_c0_g1~~TRINITY_DN22387_c0_g1_i1.p1  ORF type:complete len:432 (+),score=77.67 TRINITY_DN22387_c0_g1_i1:134-1297(+)